MKKKLYNAPETEFVDLLLPPCMVEASAPTTGDSDDEDEMGDSEGSNVGGTVGGSWENIWNMQ
ncbi:MAG: hypothetical protein IJX41_00785 [Bacteroidaceae bacterium]|nr:hypothetical protein [Bacteroidaceae bacterium]